MQKVPPPCAEAGVIRMCEEKDYPVLEGIYREQEGINMPFDYFDDFCSAIRSGDYMVAEINGQVVAGGGLHYSDWNRQGTLFFGIVERRMQRRGIGTAMLFARIKLLPYAEGLLVSMQATKWSAPFYGGFGFQWHLLEKGKNGTMLQGGSLLIDQSKLEAIAGYFDRSNLRIVCSSADFMFKQPEVEPPPADSFLDKKLPDFATRDLSESDRKVLSRMLIRTRRKKNQVRFWIILAGVLFLLAAAALALADEWNFMLLLVLTFGICAIVPGSEWFDLCEKIERSNEVLNSNACREYRVRAQIIWQRTADNPFYAFELANSQVLFLSGQRYRRTRRFPCLEFSIVQYLTSAGTVVLERICALENPSSPDFVILSPQLSAMLQMPHLTLVDGTVVSFLRRLETASPATEAQESSA